MEPEKVKIRDDEREFTEFRRKVQEAEVLSAALYARFRSRQDHTFAEKILSAMRKGFGGHQEPRA
jgi:6-phosphogluconate dehydrogenase (decarboxylating)